LHGSVFQSEQTVRQSVRAGLADVVRRTFFAARIETRRWQDGTLDQCAHGGGLLDALPDFGVDAQLAPSFRPADSGTFSRAGA